MNAALWATTLILAATLVLVGGFKAVAPRPILLKKRLFWIEDMPASAPRLIGSAELLAAVGLVFPGLLGIAPVLVPIAATCSAALLAGAVVVHVRRGDKFAGGPIDLVGDLPAPLPAALFCVMAIFVAWGRFGPYPL